MHASQRPDEDPQPVPTAGENILQGVSLPTSSLHFSLSAPGNVEGYVRVMLDQNRLPERIEIVESNESIRISALAGFSIQIESPELRHAFSKLTSPECTGENVLHYLVAARKEAESLARTLQLAPPLVTSLQDSPALQSRKVLTCGDTVEFRRLNLPGNIEEWAFNHQRHEILAIRCNCDGQVLASVSTSLLRYPDGSSLRRVEIADLRGEESRHQVYRYQRMSRTGEDLRASSEAAFELVLDLSLNSLDDFLRPYQHARPRSLTADDTRVFLKPPVETSKLHNFKNVDSTVLESGSWVGWKYINGYLSLSLSSSDSRQSSLIAFSAISQKTTPENFKRLMLLIASEESLSLGEAATQLISSRFNMTHDLNGDQSQRITPLTSGLLSHPELGNLVQKPAREFHRNAHEIFQDIARGYEWIHFADRRFEAARPSEINRVATTISFRVWQGGCDRIVLQEPGGDRITIEPLDRHFIVSSIPETRAFIAEQLALFAKNPLNLLEQHFKARNWISPILGFDADVSIFAHLKFLEEYLNHDASSEARLESPHSLKAFLREVYNQDAPEAITYFPTHPITLHANLGDTGISSLTFHLKRTMFDRLWNWRTPDTLVRIAIPEWIGNSVPLAHQLIADACKELNMCFREKQAYRVREANVRQMVDLQIAEIAAQRSETDSARIYHSDNLPVASTPTEQPGSNRAESGGNQQQGPTEHVQTRNPR